MMKALIFLTVCNLYSLLLAGEVGGLMGLMLGASVMTVCELIDLLLYNGVIKYVIRKRVGHKNDNDQVRKNDEDGINTGNLDGKDEGNGTVYF